MCNQYSNDRDYDALKKVLKTAEQGLPFGDKNEAFFVSRLDSELDKVEAFCHLKAEELVRRVLHIEQNLEVLLRTSTSSLDLLEEETSQTTGEVAQLAKFVRLNYSAFIKILKKHDKHTTYPLKNLFMIRMQSKPFYKMSFDSLILRLSKIYDTIRNGGTREVVVPPSGGGSFVRRTTKYWVHADNITEVKIHILKNLPVLIFSPKGSAEPDPAITSIYFDNDAMELYVGRLEKSQGAEAHRIRWYGNMDQTEIFFERKTHQEDWTGELSVKTRFSIKEKYVNEFLAGKYTMDKQVEKMRLRGERSDKELDMILELSREIQATIQAKGLKPMMRTFYNRTAFQLPGDARVRISLDTELTMIREDNYGKNRSGSNWRRMDAGTRAPFDHLSETDVHDFPYAVLEVKLQTHVGTTPPKWVVDLIESHLVEEVPKFSKFIHGCATLLESKVTLLPFWLPQMDKDIRKPVPETGSLLLSRVVSKASLRLDEVHVAIDEEEEEDEDDEKTPLIKAAPVAVVDKGKSVWFRESKPKEEIPRTMNGKKIVLPVRVEPKVFFANERTFLSWLHFCIVLGGLALGLLNFGDKVGQISGAIFTVLAMLFMIYGTYLTYLALFLYNWRAEKIRNRDAGPYDDRLGPTVLVISLFCAVVTNFYLKFTSQIQ